MFFLGNLLHLKSKKSFPFGTPFRPRLNGIVEGDMTSEATAVALSKQLDSIITECRDASNISVTYYTTDLPCQTGSTHNLEELMRLFRDFRSKTSSGEIKETPIEVSCTSLNPWESTFPKIYHGRGGLQTPRRFISKKTAINYYIELSSITTAVRRLRPCIGQS